MIGNKTPAYAELQVASNYSFLRGASHADELVGTAAALGLSAIAITDRNTLAGVVRAHVAAKEAELRLVVGCRLDLIDGPSLLCLPTDRAAYGRLCRLLTLGKRRAEKGECILTLEDVYGHAEGQIFIAVPPEEIEHEAFKAELRRIAGNLAAPCYLAAHYLYRGDDRRRITELAAIARDCGTPLVATGDIHYHIPERRFLQDVVTCIREHCTIREAGYRLHANAERHLKSPAEMARLFAGHEDAIARTVEIAEACRFSLDDLAYNYPAGQDAATASRGPDLDGGHVALPRGCAGQGGKGVEEGARADRQAQLRALFPYRARHRAMGEAQGSENSLSGPGVGGQFRRLLLPLHHLG
jgi:error-prone DNA polymerase